MYKSNNFKNFIQAFRSENITDIAQGAAENPGDAFDLDHKGAVTRQNVRMTVGVTLVGFAAGIAAVICPRVMNSRLIINQLFGPDLVNVNITGKVKHIGGETARRPHIDFQGHVPVDRRLEEFDVKKPFPHIKGPEAVTADLFQTGRNIAQRIVV